MFNSIKRLFNANPPDRDPFDDRWFPSFAPLFKTTTGRKIDHNIALTYSGVWAASTLIADTIATLPKALYRIERVENRRRLHPDVDHVSHWAFGLQPNPTMSDVDFWSAQIYFLLNWGNCFAIKEYDSRGGVSQLWLIHPSRIPLTNVKRNKTTGRLTYKINTDPGEPEIDPIEQRDMLHIRGRFPFNGYWGQGVLPHGKNTVAGGLAQDEFVNRFFENDASVGVVVSYPNKVDPKTLGRLQASWAEYQKLANAHAPYVVDGGPNIERLGLPLDTSQFLENRQFTVTEIARWYNLPPHLLRDLTRSSFNNIESESIHYVVISLMPWITRIEQALNTQLLSVKDRSRREFKFDATALLRGDMQSRAEFYTQLFNIGALTTNDILEREGMNPVEGEEGDLRFVQVNLQTIGSAKLNEDLLQKTLDTDPVEQAKALAEINSPEEDDESSDDDNSQPGDNNPKKRKKGPSEDNNAPPNRGSNLGRNRLNEPFSTPPPFTLESSSPEDAVRTLMRISHSSLQEEYNQAHAILNGSRESVVSTIASLDASESEAITDASKDYRTFSSKIRDYYAELISREDLGLPGDASPKTATILRNWFIGECTLRMNALIEAGESAPLEELEPTILKLYQSWLPLSRKADEAFS